MGRWSGCWGQSCWIPQGSIEVTSLVSLAYYLGRGTPHVGCYYSIKQTILWFFAIAQFQYQQQSSVIQAYQIYVLHWRFLFYGKIEKCYRLYLHATFCIWQRPCGCLWHEICEGVTSSPIPICQVGWSPKGFFCWPTPGINIKLGTLLLSQDRYNPVSTGGIESTC